MSVGRVLADVFTGGLAEIGFHQADVANKKAAAATAAAQTPASPQVNSPDSTASNQAALRRIGRAALIQTSPQGILGNPSTGRSQLSAI